MEPFNPDGPFDQNTIYEVPVGLIFADESFNCRGEITGLDVYTLAKQIDSQGLIQPITIQPWDKEEGKKFRIVAGYRRYRAHLVLEKPTIRCTIKTINSDLDARVINLDENLGRKDLNILQEAKAIDPFRRAGWSETEVGDKFGKSKGWVQNRYYVLALPEEIQHEIAEGRLNTTQIRECYYLETYEQKIEYVKKIKDAVLLGRKRTPKAENIIKRMSSKKVIRSQDEIFALQDILFEYLGPTHFAVKALGWAAAIVDDKEMHEALKEEARKNGRYYEIPRSFDVRKKAASV